MSKLKLIILKSVIKKNMIIKCINCNKKFIVNDNLIPEIGRKIQCGSCDHDWHYKIKKLTLELPILDKKNNEQEKNLEINKPDIFETKLVNENKKKPEEHKNIKKNELKISKKINLFSYFIVFIISFMAMIILVDTMKTTLIEIFPRLEIILFNFFETLKDVKLFIIDLT